VDAAPAIELWHCVDARSFRALWALEELGLPYRLHLLPFPPRVHVPEYLEENPLGTIPLLVDGETRMTESGAIGEYLAARYVPETPLTVKPQEPDFGAYLNALHYGEATLTFPQTLVLRYRDLEPQERRQPQVVEDYARWFFARLRWLTARLEGRAHICDRFTLADISVGYALLLAAHIGLGDRLPPIVAAYRARLQARDGYGRARAAQSG